MPAQIIHRLFPAFITLTLIAILIPWAVSVLRTPLHSDLVWLYEGFVRLMSGQAMAQSIFEPNPPLSLFTYAIPYGLSALTGLPSYITIFVYVMAMLGAAAVVVKYVVTKITGPNSFAPLLVTSAFVISQSIMTTSLYGERDHLIAIALVPFVLMQYALTKGLVIPQKLQWPIFLIGAVVILLKPHHGLIPFFMIIHRMLRQNNLRFLHDADFLSLAFVTLTYVVLLFFCFVDYRVIIFPDVLRLYLPNHRADILKQTGILLIPGVIVLAVARLMRYKIRHSELTMLLAICALACLIPYVVQGKGFFYHLFPALGFFIPAAFMLLAGLLEKEIGNMRLTLTFMLAALLGLSYTIFPLNLNLPDYKAYRAMPLTKIVTDNCRGVPDCSFMMFNDTMGIIHETAYVTGLTHGSRFPSYWFLPEMRRMDYKKPGSASMLRAGYATRIAEDLEHYKPQTLVIGRFDVHDNAFFDFAAYWAVSKLFRDAWEKYEHVGTIEISYADYYPGTIAAQEKPVTYDLYRRHQGQPALQE